jgi:hypothetical protein
MSKADPVFIQPGDYPVLSGEGARELKKALRSTATAMAAKKALTDSIVPMREAVLAALPRLEAAGADPAKIYAEAHEIRGLAGNAGLAAAAKISGVLCLYLDGMMRAGRSSDMAVVGLCVAAIGRAARALDEETRLGQHVVKELGVLVSRKLADTAEPQSP